MTSIPVSSSRAGARQSKLILRISFLVVSTVLVFIVTRLASVPISVWGGQVFDLGDVMVFTFAWTFGPGIGAFAGGVGSGISDASQVSVFWPYTLVIKGTEGLLAGFIARRAPSFKLGSRKLSPRNLSWIAASFVMVGGYFLTNWIFLGFGFWAGVYELPFDIAQVVAGRVAGGPLAEYLRRSIPVIAPGVAPLASKKS